MTALLDGAPYAARDDDALLDELKRLTHWHQEGCPPYAATLTPGAAIDRLSDVPFLHVSVFKHQRLVTEHEGVSHQRTLTSSATTSGRPSLIALDDESSALQSRSTRSILGDFVGTEPRPLLVLDGVSSLRQRGRITARLAAGLALQPMATSVHFLLRDPDDAASTKWDALVAAVEEADGALVYGFTSILWQALVAADPPAEVLDVLRSKRIDFVHSGGWKRLEAMAITPAELEAALLERTGPGSRVIDYYGMAEQVGIIFPLCEAGYRHVPRWADVVVRDPWTTAALTPEREGQLQLLNVLAKGAPYHSVLSEDLGVLHEDGCPCGRLGRRFTLRGRVPKAEVRGCANV